MDEDYKRLVARIEKMKGTLNLIAQRLGIYNTDDRVSVGPQPISERGGGGSGGLYGGGGGGGGPGVATGPGGSGTQPNHYEGGGGGWADIRGVKGGR